MTAVLYICALAVVFVDPVGAAENGTPEVSVSPADDGAVRISGRITIPAADGVVWDVLTDYDRLAAYVQPLESSRVVERQDDSTVVVEQTSVGRFAVFSRRSRALFVSHHHGTARITTTFLEGDFHEHASEWRLSGVDAGGPAVRLEYEATVRSTHAAPSWIVRRIARSAVVKTLEAIRDESLRRTGPAIRGP